ncbi:ABC transporter permease [Virgibacillus sp. C22-A2]|uniref:ABC transporter permease n=1 Tax=Virgibacillus tibetensis TaxID=3042313 RepID=A0ABU6KGD2_9BACI|nr:ABC transporter permease [Virgibacillus sp. C22-A2]
MQWLTLFKKEMLENWRNKKWIWVPLVLILIAVIDPITNYYLPQIIESTGGFPDGTVLELPEFAPPEVVMMSLSQFSSLGVLVIVLMSMGTIAGERKSGVMELVLVKPVSYRNYITAKWAALVLLVWSALLLGMFASWYYINILFGDLSFLSLLQIVLFYGLWLTLVVTLSIFYNTLFRTPGLVAFITVITIMAMSVVTQIFGHILEWSPNHLSSYIHDMLITGSISFELIATAVVSIVFIILLLISAISLFKTKELSN